ncbi:hypothetical protein F5B22DRAFT_651205 [Xylaria bambusicola]|uniref:uncharacterized protein n=1 Tax=Xylaria bambusicola TaxID=326684 RepID=UPI0020076492|nr:uncharacterized protein F5B22DRAFT_651205 [Xylaria bambusicola]KAI0505917.1 hypothetical protein F5B22DRAFT_651205 [Xylaria bambusicola]
MPAPIFNFDFSSPHRPSVPSPLSSSPLRPSQASPPLSPRDPNTLPRRDTQSSPIRGPSHFKYSRVNVKPNPLRLSREKAQESRRTLFLKNVRKRTDDKKWEQRGGDQEALKLEWHILDKQRRQEKDTDLDGFVYENELEDIPENPYELSQEADNMMVDAMAQEEEAELDAMLSLLDAEASSQVPRRPGTPSLSDDEDYDTLFMDILSQQTDEGDGFISSGQMDMS